MVAYLHRGYYRHPDPSRVAAAVADFVEDALRAADRDRRHTDAPVVDLHYRRLLTDPIVAVGDIYHAAGLHLSDDARQRMTAWLARNRQHKHGVHHYAPDDF